MIVFESNADPDTQVVYLAYKELWEIEIVVNKVQLRRQHSEEIREIRKQKTKSTGDHTVVAGTLLGVFSMVWYTFTRSYTSKETSFVYQAFRVSFMQKLW